MESLKPILLVEDDRLHAAQVERALDDLRVMNPLVHTLNGQEALGYLRNEANETPCLILLDLDMPRMNGIELLQAIEKKKLPRTMPVILLASSASERDTVGDLQITATDCIVKPVNYKMFVEMVRKTQLRWSLTGPPSGE